METISGKSLGITAALLLVASGVGVALYHHSTEAADAAHQASLAEHRSPANACVDFTRNHSPAADSNTMQAHARELAAQSRFDDALAEYQHIAGVDPGLPGLNLDISQTLLKLNRPRQAKEAINSQIAVSDCLPRLTLDSMDEYCKSENFPSTMACMHELNSIQQSAYIHAALVQAELGRALAPDHAAEASASPAPSLKPQPAHPHAASQPAPTHTLVAANNSDKEPKLKPVKHANPNQLASGTGTDAALGAYSK